MRCRRVSNLTRSHFFCYNCLDTFWNKQGNGTSLWKQTTATTSAGSTNGANCLGRAASVAGFQPGSQSRFVPAQGVAPDVRPPAGASKEVADEQVRFHFFGAVPRHGVSAVCACARSFPRRAFAAQQWHVSCRYGSAYQGRP